MTSSDVLAFQRDTEDIACQHVHITVKAYWCFLLVAG